MDRRRQTQSKFTPTQTSTQCSVQPHLTYCTKLYHSYIDFDTSFNGLELALPLPHNRFITCLLSIFEQLLQDMHSSNMKPSRTQSQPKDLEMEVSLVGAIGNPIIPWVQFILPLVK